jgi:hypothetical protein
VITTAEEEKKESEAGKKISGTKVDFDQVVLEAVAKKPWL